MASNENFPQVIPVVEVRVLDAAKKSSFKIRRSTNFPVVATVQEFRSALLVAFPDLAEIAQPCFSVGYIAERNKKLSINSNLELESAYDALIGGYAVWMDPREAPIQSKPLTRPKRECRVS